MNHSVLQTIAAWVGLNIRYRVRIRSQDDIDVGLAARRVDQFEELLDAGYLDVVMWRGWRRRTGHEALSALRSLIGQRGFFLAYANTKVTTDDGRTYESAARAPTDSQLVSIEFRGQLPFKSLTG